MRRPLLLEISTGFLVLVLTHLVTSETLIWQDEFDTLNFNEWTHLVSAFGIPNKQFQYYRNDRKNSYVRDGILYLRPTFTADEFGEDFLYSGNLSYPDCNFEPCASIAGEDIVEPILSARIYSNYSFKYGRVEVRAQVPRGDWLWPAIWMQPKNSVYGPWPRSGEIDIMETKGNVNYFDSHGVSQGVDRVMSTLHWGPDQDHNKYMKTHWEISMEGTGHTYADDFHLYGMTWTENYITFTVDDKEIGTVNPPEGGFWNYGNFENDPGGTNIWQNGSKLAPFDEEFFLIFNVAVGGTFFADDIGNRPWNWDGHPRAEFWESRAQWMSTWNGEDIAMKIDYVRVYQ